jgi:protein tyrosine phosphatase (PTP) superfamily phosphohydrolase (DUF442 family)
MIIMKTSSIKILNSTVVLTLGTAVAAHGDDSSLEQSFGGVTTNSSYSQLLNKQFWKNMFQNTNASPQDAYVFPSKLGFVAPMDLPNFHQVDPYLYRGGTPTEDGLKVLKKMGIKTVVDLRKPSAEAQAESHEVKALGMHYINLPISRGVPEIPYQEKFFHLVEDAEKKPNTGAVFVHCQYGCDRTGYMVSMWRVQHDHWTSYDAMQEMLKYGYLVHLAGPEEPLVRSWLYKLENQGAH